ncbi:hypothetical protein ACFE04_018009 [Oxalis oulophora]
MANINNEQDTGSPGWSLPYFMQLTEDVVSPRFNSKPSIVFSSKDDSTGSIQKLRRHLTSVIKGLSQPPQATTSTSYNPEVLTTQKRQWASFQLQYLDHRPLIQPSRLFEAVVVAGLHPNCDIRALQRQYIDRKSEGSSGRFRSALTGHNHSRVEPSLEPQVLFVYPPEKELPLQYKDLLSFCFPGGLEVHAVEKTPSMSELNEMLLAQEHFKRSDLSFVFRLQVADDSTLFGCCVLVDEIVQKPSGLLSMITEKQQQPTLSRYVLTTRRCYCIISRLPFFELHFGVLNSIFTEERLERITKGIELLDVHPSENISEEKNIDDVSPDHKSADNMSSQTKKVSQLSSENNDDGSNQEHKMIHNELHLSKNGINDNIVVPIGSELELVTTEREISCENTENSNVETDDGHTNKNAAERRLPNGILPLLRYNQCDSSDSSPSFQGSPCEDRHFRCVVDGTETEEASSSGQDDSIDHNDILEWAKANKLGSLQILCEYYRLPIPSRGSTLKFRPLEHLHPQEYHRPDKTVFHTGGSTIDLRSCSTSLEFAEAHSALLAEEEATTLSTWTIASLCGTLRLENILTMLAGALLEKQIVVVCSNLGILSTIVLSIIPLIRPYQWQSLLLPVLPNDMLEFLDAPVPYIVGVKSKNSEVQSKLSNVMLVDVNKNQVKSSTVPQLPQQKELLSSLSPYHAKLVGESYLAKKRPVYECTDVQVEAAEGFLYVLRSYLDSLCSNLRSHTITNVQSNNDKVSLLLKESFIDSFPSRDRSFMKVWKGSWKGSAKRQ